MTMGTGSDWMKVEPGPWDPGWVARATTGRTAAAHGVRRGSMLLCGAMALALALAGCAGDPPPEAAGEYPDISESPTERPSVAPAREREEIAEGLRADRRDDGYADAGAGAGEPQVAATGGERRRSSEVRPPEYSPPPASDEPATVPLADRMDAGEVPAPNPGGITRQDLPPPPGGSPAGMSGMASPTPGAPMPAQGFPGGPMIAGMPGAPARGPVVVDSRGVTTLGPGGPVTSAGPYGSPYGNPYGASLAAAGHTPGMMPPTAAAATAPGTLPLSTYGPMMGARSQRVAVIYFADGSSRLSGRDRQVLRQVADLQRQYRGVLRVVGHASSRTNATNITRHKLANFNVSLERANTVATALMNNGVAGRFLYVGAVSDRQPVYYEVMPTGEAGNRRAEIYLDY